MKVSEIISQLLGKSMDKDYDFSITEKETSSTVKPESDSTGNDGSKQEEFIKDNDGAVTDSMQEDKIKKLEEELNSLKAVNMKLLQGLNLENRGGVKDDIAMIYDICIGEDKEA